jgi:hypothetical protein
VSAARSVVRTLTRSLAAVDFARGGAAQFAVPQLRAGGQGVQATAQELFRTFDSYMYNTLFEELGAAAFDWVLAMDLDNFKPRGVYNPVPTIVDFYANYVLSGTLTEPPPTDQTETSASHQPDGDLWAITDTPPLVGALADVWRWSNLDLKLPELGRNAANYGNCLLVASEEPRNAADPTSEDRVYVEVRHPGELTELERHKRGHLTYAKLQSTEVGTNPRTGQPEEYTLTRAYTKTQVATYRNGEPFDYYGTGRAVWDNPHGFVPVVLVRHLPITGEDLGVNAYAHELPKVHELCLQASMLGTLIGMHLAPQWAVFGAEAPEDEEAEVDRKDAMWFFPQGTSMEPFIAKLDIAGAYVHLRAMLEDLEDKFPELRLNKVGDAKRDISGSAVRGILTGLIRRGGAARKLYDAGLRDALTMAVSMGQNLGGTGRGLWPDLPIDRYNYQNRGLDFRLHWPDILPMSRLERLRLQAEEAQLELQIASLQQQVDLVRSGVVLPATGAGGAGIPPNSTQSTLGSPVGGSSPTNNQPR